MAAIRIWKSREARGQTPDVRMADSLYGELVILDREEKNYPQCLADLEELKKVSPTPEAVDKLIEEVKAQMAAAH